MKQTTATGQLFGKVVTLKKVTKNKAAKLFAEGKEIYLQSSNMYPFNIWQSAFPIKLDIEQLNADKKHNEFCINLHTENIANLSVKNEDWSKDIIIRDKAKIVEYSAKVINEFSQFQSVCNNYSYYNCDNERGNYINFFELI